MRSNAEYFSKNIFFNSFPMDSEMVNEEKNQLPRYLLVPKIQ